MNRSAIIESFHVLEDVRFCCPQCLGALEIDAFHLEPGEKLSTRVFTQQLPFPYVLWQK
jgi:hypothetical protein